MSLFYRFQSLFLDHASVIALCMYVYYLFGLVKISCTRCFRSVGCFQLQKLQKRNHEIDLMAEGDWILEVECTFLVRLALVIVTC